LSPFTFELITFDGKFGEKSSNNYCIFLNVPLSSIFNGQEQLLVHLLSKMKYISPIQTKWMLPIECDVKAFKSFVGQKSRLKII
jgi:hypothetical protein